jgi:hypothetical protein
MSLIFLKLYFSSEKAGCAIKIVVGVQNKVKSKGPLQNTEAIKPISPPY